MISDKYILVIEDDFDLLWLIQKILEVNGFKILTAVTGEQAISKFSRNVLQIQAVILDLSLPDESGEYLCSEFLKVSPDLPIIITTGLEDRTQRRRLEKMGVRGYLVKPFDLMNLVQFLSKVL